jgi:pimeloyl-ACP methyl ester carboxylesterase
LFENDISSLAISLSLGIDQRSGMLPCGGLHRHRHAQAGKELDLWVNWLQQQGLEKIWLLGHSRGGNQVSSFVLTHPGKIHGLILIAPPSVDNLGLAENYQQAYGKPLASMLALAQMQSANGSGLPLENIGFLHCNQAEVSPQSFLSYYRDADMNTAQLLERIKLSVLVVSGSEDKVSPDIGPAAARLGQSNISLLEVDGADHFFRDLYADDIIDEIIELLGAGG